MTTYLCNSIGVSKSGYYNYLKNESKRIEKQIKDEEDFKWMMKATKEHTTCENKANRHSKIIE